MSPAISAAMKHMQKRGYVFVEAFTQYDIEDDSTSYRMRFRTSEKSPLFNYVWKGMFSADKFDNWDADHANLPEDG